MTNFFTENKNTYFGSDALHSGESALRQFTYNSMTDYTNRFKALESSISKPVDVEQMRTDASTRARAAYSGTTDQMARARTNLDMGARGDQISSEKRRVGLARAISDVDAQNRAITSGRAMTKDAQSSALDMYGSDLSTARSLMSSVAAAEAGRDSAARIASAQQSAADDQMVASVFGAAVSAISDRRLKKHIRRIGSLPSGLSVYEYSYVWDDAKHVGVMADEARELFPDAVHTMACGYLCVNYAGIQ
jgi:hypothetical protein